MTGAVMLGLFCAGGGNTSLPPRVHEIVILTRGSRMARGLRAIRIGLCLTVCAIVNAFEVPVPVGTQPESSTP